MSGKIKPCPFCGIIPEFEEYESYIGTQYEYYCDCGLSCSCIQICDLMTIEERASGWNDSECKYNEEFFNRAKKATTENWNKRT
jgi:hypothetical protein